MPRADFFKPFGIFVEPRFLDDQSCKEIIAEVAASHSAPAQVYKDNYVRHVDERERKTLRVSASQAVVSLVEARMSMRRAALEEHFHLALGDCEEPEFLVYRAGDFFCAHRDAYPEASIDDHLKRRRVSLVLFLNGQTNDGAAGTFSGGSLVFYGLMRDKRTAQVGFPLVAEPGLLVAFPSELAHEVTAVTQGERYTVVSWFRDREDN